MASAATRIDLILNAVDHATNVINRVIGNTNKQVSSLQNRLDKFHQSVIRSSDFRDAMLNVSEYGHGIARALKSPIATAIAFEKQMSTVKAITRANDEEITRLIETARHLGATTSFSATQAAQGMEYLGMAGFKTHQIIAAMPGMLNLAKAAGRDLAITADIASDISSGFFGADAANQMGRVGDVLTHTFTSANTDLQMLSETMKYVAPVARTAGMSLEQTAAMAGLMANVGIKASQSGTAMRAIISRLAAPPKPAMEALERLGVVTKDAAGNLRSVPDIFKDVAAAMERLKMGSADKIAAFAAISGLEAATGMGELITQAGNKGLDAYLKGFESVEGTAARVAETMGNNLAGKITELSSAWESVQITLGSFLLPVLTTLLKDHITPLVQAIDGWIQRHPVLAKNIMLGAAAVSAFLLSFAAVGKFVWIANTLIAGFNLTLAALVASPIGVALAGIAYAGFKIYQYWQPLTAFFSSFWDTFSGALAPLAELFAPILGLFSGFGEHISFTTTELQEFSAMGAMAGQAIGSMLTDSIRYVTQSLGIFIQGLRNNQIVQTLASGVKNAGLALYNAMRWVLQRVRNLLPFSPAKEGPLSDLDVSGQRLVDTLVSGVISQADSLYQAMKNVASKSVQGIKDGWAYIRSGAIVTDVQTLISHIMQAMESMRQRIVSQPWETLGVMGMLSGLQSVLDMTMPVRDSLFIISEAISGAFSGDWSFLLVTVTTLKTGMEALKQRFVQFQDLDLSLLKQKIIHFATQAQNSLRFAFSWEGVKAGFQGFLAFTKRFVMNYASIGGSLGKMLITSWFMTIHAMQLSAVAGSRIITGLFQAIWKSLKNPGSIQDIFGQWANKSRLHLKSISTLWTDVFLNPKALGGQQIKTLFSQLSKAVTVLYERFMRLGGWKATGLLGALVTIGSIFWENRDRLGDWAQQWRHFLSEHIPGWHHIERVASIVSQAAGYYFSTLAKPFQYIGTFIGNAAAQAHTFWASLALPSGLQNAIQSVQAGFQHLFSALKTYAPMVLSIIFPVFSLFKLLRTPLPKLQKFQAILLVLSMTGNAIKDLLKMLGLLGGGTYVVFNFWDTLSHVVAASYNSIRNTFYKMIAMAGDLTLWWQGLSDGAQDNFKKLAIVAGVMLGGVVWKIRSAIKGAMCDPAYQCASKMKRIGMIMQRLPGLKTLGGFMAGVGTACSAGKDCVEGQLTLWQKFKAMSLTAWTALRMQINATAAAASARLAPVMTAALMKIRAAALTTGRATWALLMRIPVVGHLARGLLFVSTIMYGKFASAIVFAKGLLLKTFAAIRIAAMTNPVGAIIMGVIALGAAAYLVYKNWDVIVAWWSGLWDKAKAIFQQYVEWLNSFIPGLGDLVSATYALIGNIAVIIKDGFTEAFNSIMQGDWAGVGMAIIRTIGKGVMAVGTFLYDAVASVFTLVRNLLPFSPAKEGPFSQLDQNGFSIIKTIADGIFNAASVLLESMQNVFTQVTEWFAGIDWGQLGIDLMTKLGDGIKSMAGQIRDAIMDMMPHPADIAKKVTSAASNAVSHVNHQRRDVTGNVMDWFGVGDDLAGINSPARFSTGGPVKGPGSDSSDSIPALLSNNEFIIPAPIVRQFGVDYFERIRRGEAPMPQGFFLGGLVGKIGSAIKGGASKLWSAGTSAVGGFMQQHPNVGLAMGEMAQNFQFDAQNATQNLSSHLKSTLQKAAVNLVSNINPALGGFTHTLINGIQQHGVKGMLSQLKTGARSVVQEMRGNLADNAGKMLSGALKSGQLPGLKQVFNTAKTSVLSPVQNLFKSFSPVAASKPALSGMLSGASSGGIVPGMNTPSLAKTPSLLGSMGSLLDGSSLSAQMPDLGGFFGGNNTPLPTPSSGSFGDLGGGLAPSGAGAGSGVNVTFGDINITLQGGKGGSGEGQLDMAAIGEQVKQHIQMALDEAFRGRMFD